MDLSTIVRSATGAMLLLTLSGCGRQRPPSGAATAEAFSAPSEEQVEDLRDFVLIRPPVPYTRARGAEPVSTGEAAPVPLPKDGSPVVGRVCRLRPEDGTGWHQLDFADADPKRPAPRVLRQVRD